MKTKRLDAILDIIREKDIATQEELLAELRARGFDVTQATVSRDIRHLQLVKRQTETGKSIYAVHELPGVQERGRLLRVLQASVRTVDTAQNLLVIRTDAGMAMGAAAAIDSLSIEGIVGCIAGDDTIMAALRTTEAAEEACGRLIRDLQLN